MKERVISGIFIAGLSLLFCYLGGIPLTIVSLVLSSIAYLELSKATGVLVNKQDNVDVKDTADKKINSLQIVGILGLIGYYSVIFLLRDFEFLLLVIMLTFIVTMFVYVVSYPKYEARQVINSLFSFVYGGVMLSFLLLVRLYSNEMDTEHFNIGFYFVWFILIAAWFSDTCAYFVGVLIGKHKIFPRLSPKKTFEGCFGGVCGSTLGFVIYGLVLKNYGIVSSEDLILFVVLGILGSVVAQIGDLTASAIKRNNNIKDYGHLIPGHGGIMDRFDSIIFVSPLVYILISVFFRFI